MSALVDTFDPLDAAEVHRRRLLAESDCLLEQVEELRLADQVICPPALAEAIRSLLLRLGRVPAERPRTVRAAHHQIFGIQGRLMAANPRHPRPRFQAGRPAGAPRLALLREGAAWKFLALPQPPVAAEASAVAEWRLLVQLTVARALDRWGCAQDQAVHAARVRRGADCALHRARAAWRNYWELRCEAEALLGRSMPSRPVRRTAAPGHAGDAGARGTPGPRGRARAPPS